jgi:hypothetical protein
VTETQCIRWARDLIRAVASIRFQSAVSGGRRSRVPRTAFKVAISLLV